jgi:hypothetical protein
MNARQIVADAIKRVTQKFQEDHYPDIHKILSSLPITPKSRKLGNFLSKTPFGCQNDDVTRLVELMLDVKIPLRGEKFLPYKGTIPDSQWPLFLAITVMGDSDDDHRYGIDEVIIAIDPEDPSENMLRKDGTTGGDMSRYKCDFRPAFPQEIDKFIQDLPTDKVNRYFGTLIGAAEAIVGAKVVVALTAKEKAAKKAAKKAPSKKKATKKKAVKKTAKKKVPRKKRR